MTGDRRADFISLNPDDGGLRLWENRCWSLPASSPPGSTLPPGTSPPGITETFTDGSGDTLTTTLPPGKPITSPITTTNSAGSVCTHFSQVLNVSFQFSRALADLPKTITLMPPSVVETFTDNSGHTITTTLPPGSSITTPIVITSGGSVRTLL